MSQSLPMHGFRWLTQEEIELLVIENLVDDTDDGFIFEVDLKYPRTLHDRHNDYPLAPERLTIDGSMLSPLQQTFPEHKKKPTSRLAPNLRNKTNYVDHQRNLKLLSKFEAISLAKISSQVGVKH